MPESPKNGNVDVARRLIDLAALDTVFRDIYLRRGAEAMKPLLDEEGYRSLDHEQTVAATLPDSIRQAMAVGDWGRVSELSTRLRSAQCAIEGGRNFLDLGRKIYSAEPVVLDPFSPGLQGLANVTARDLSELRTRAIGGLAELEKTDPQGRLFYAARRQAFTALVLGDLEEAAPTSSSASNALLKEKAAEALAKGNFGTLEEIARRLAKSDDSSETETADLGETQDDPEERDLLLTFSEATRRAAARLGLVPLRAPSWHERFRHLRRYAWHPTFGLDPGSPESAPHPRTYPLPLETPDALRERLMIYASHPCVNSGGARLLPWLSAEDALVEDFPDPPTGPQAPGGPIPSLLGLERRHALSRRAIEQALRTRSPQVLWELGLSPHEFRVVCIPTDLHMRLGLEQGWGNQPLWTHFDGYMVMGDRHLRPLAGGDVRFGGIYDLVSIGMDYESDGIIVRFAVIQRRRMQAW